MREQFKKIFQTDNDIEWIFMMQKLRVEFKNSLIKARIYLSFSYNLGFLRVYRSCAIGAHTITPIVNMKPEMTNIKNTIENNYGKEGNNK